MKADMLLDPFGDIDDEFLEDDEAKAPAKRYGWIKWAAVAACVLIAVLIAVPALWDKAPEVEPEPVESTPIEEPINEPVDEPQNSSSSIYGASGVYGTDAYTIDDDGTIVYSRSYDSYNEFAFDVQDPVYEAFAASETAQEHEISYFAGVADDGQGNKKVYSASLAFENWTRAYSSLGVQSWYIHEGQGMEFAQAEDLGVVTTFQVDGIEIQKYTKKDYYAALFPDSGIELGGDLLWERVHINGVWYYVYGTIESEVDEIATALAHCAS